MTCQQTRKETELMSMNGTTLHEVEMFLTTLRRIDEEKRHTTVSMKTTKVGWTVKKDPGRVVIETMLIYNTAPYIRNKRQKTLNLSDPREVLFPKIEKWWSQKVL